MDYQFLLLLLLLGLSIYIVTHCILWFTNQNPLTIERRLAQIKSLSRQSQEEMEARSGFFARNVLPFLRDASGKLAQYAPDELKNNFSVKISQAKYPFGLSANEYIGFGMLLTIMLPAFLVVMSLIAHASYKTTFWLAVLGAVLGAGYPYFVVHSRITRFTAQIRNSLPFAIDLLTVCVEAGLGFNAALAKVAEKGQGALNDEFRRVLKEIAMGKSRPEALQDMADRNKAVDELGVLVNTIVQTEKMGVPIAKVLRVQADEIRRKRRQRIEEAAMKLPVKMMFPLVFFIFPVMFIVLLGPAIISIIEVFKKV